MLLLSCSDTIEEEYRNIKEAEKDGAIIRGWIPSWLPKSTSEIKEVHDLDINSSILAFIFDPNETWDIENNCKRIDASEVPKPSIKRKWWPGTVPPGNFVTPAHSFYSCEDGGAYLAVAYKHGLGYFWRP